MLMDDIDPTTGLFFRSRAKNSREKKLKLKQFFLKLKQYFKKKLKKPEIFQNPIACSNITP